MTVSNCCSAAVLGENNNEGICAECSEHCVAVEIKE